MAIQFPQIKPIEDLAEMLKIVSSSKLYKERMEEIGKGMSFLSEQIGLVHTVKDIDQMRSDATARLTEAANMEKAARAIKEDADARNKLATSNLEKLSREEARLKADLEAQAKQDEDRLKESLGKREKDIAEMEADITKRLSELAARERLAQNRIAEATEQKNRYETMIEGLRRQVA
jgi:hypothetical protein